MNGQALFSVEDGISNASARGDAAEVGAVETQVLKRLQALCGEKGALSLAADLEGLVSFVGKDLWQFEQAWRALPDERDLVTRSSSHLLTQSGKRLRPLCVVLASHLGTGPSPAAIDMAVAAELVHCATLLHDDVVDLSDARRGAPTARKIYGNAASIFAGDWLLIHALRRVHAAHLPGVLDTLLATIDEMIAAEAIQLENRGKIEPDRETYFRVIDGKTAALFRWAMYAGGRAGGLSEAECSALSAFGTHLGLSFQLMDDLLDLTGNPEVTGKALFTDLREGKTTFPLILTIEQQPELRATLEAICAAPLEQPLPEAWVEQVLLGIRRAGAESHCLALAHQEATKALECLKVLPNGRARTALHTVVLATLSREK